MSLAPYSYRPITPPGGAAGQQAHSRNYSSASSYYTNSTATDTSPESVVTISTSSSRSPILRQNGPVLLPKIRTQDSSLDPSAAGQSRGGHRRGSSTNSIHSFGRASQRPPSYRCATEPVESTNLMSPISNAPLSRATSLAPTPSPGLQYAHLHRTKKVHSRHGSASSVDSTVLSRFGYPTYRQMPSYQMQQQQQQMPSPATFPEDYFCYQNNSAMMEPPVINLEATFDMPATIDVLSRPISLSPSPPIVQPALATLASQPPIETSSLITYLTQPTPAMNLVRNLSSAPGRGMSSHFWWDIRNLRPWTEFNMDTFSSMPDLLTLLLFQHASSTFPSVHQSGSHLPTLSPASEPELVKHITTTYFPRCNLGTQLSLGHNSIHLYPAPLSKITNTASAPTFLANHPTDSDRTLTGLPRGRMVGVCKSFDKWNSGMYREGAPSKVKYLRGLAHLQKCMRDHSCRYGFIITEIELLCVRAGSDERGQPYFGYLELAEPIATKTFMPEGGLGDEDFKVPMTASLALYFMLMLSKETPLPGQLSSFMDVGASGALTRQRIWHGCDVPEEDQGKDGKDKRIPEPQTGEKREARTVRGWVWPSDPWHKREGGGSKRRG
ncbi:hypothetical protein DV737_g5177, partial [Chaetothyriales sp. CBS 132003]